MIPSWIRVFQGTQFIKVFNSSDKNIQLQPSLRASVSSPVARWELRRGCHDQLEHAAPCYPTGKHVKIYIYIKIERTRARTRTYTNKRRWDCVTSPAWVQVATYQICQEISGRWYIWASHPLIRYPSNPQGERKMLICPPQMCSLLQHLISTRHEPFPPLPLPLLLLLPSALWSRSAYPDWHEHAHMHRSPFHNYPPHSATSTRRSLNENDPSEACAEQTAQVLDPHMGGEEEGPIFKKPVSGDKTEKKMILKFLFVRICTSSVRAMLRSDPVCGDELRLYCFRAQVQLRSGIKRCAPLNYLHTEL